jgi:hypothetical protein
MFFDNKNMDNKQRSNRDASIVSFFMITLLLMVYGPRVRAQAAAPDIASKLNGFDS